MRILLALIALFILQGLYRNWGKKTFDALPEHINEPWEWDGKDDDDHWYTKWKKQVKGWFAFGPLSNYRWARFREYPKFLVGLGDRSLWRIEDNDNNSFYVYPFERLLTQPGLLNLYVSRVQYKKKWHIGLQWPLFLHGHYGNWQFYIGFKRDADRVYWLSFFIGHIWK